MTSRVPRGVRRLVPARLRTWLSRTLGYPARRPPDLSVIVPVHNVEDYLAECLDSLLAQTAKRLDIIIVDDGSTDRSPVIIDRYARADSRITVISQEHQGLGAARNAGIRAASGRYLTFLDSDDTIPHGAYRQMIEVLDRTGSDFVVGAVRRVRNGKRSVPSWTKNVHRVERLGVTIDEFPEAMQDVIACNRMFRREFWTGRVGLFEEGVAYEDHVPMVTAYLRARSFDVLTAFTYNWRIRENATSISQQRRQASNLRDRLRAKSDAYRVVSVEGSDHVRAAWLGRVISTDLPAFVPAALASNKAYRETLRKAASEFWARSGPEALSRAPADRKVMMALVVAGRWLEVDRLIEWVRLNGVLPETTVEHGRILGRIPFGEDLDLPPEVFELSMDQSVLVSAVSGLHWDADRTLHLDGWACVRGIDATEVVPEIEAWFQELTGSRVIPLELSSCVCTEASQVANDPNQRYDQAGFQLRLRADQLPSSGRWQLRVRVRIQGVERSGAVHTLTRFGSYDRLPSAPAVDEGDPVRLVLLFDEADGFLLETRRDRYRAVTLRSQPDGRLTATIRSLGPDPEDPVAAVLVGEGSATSMSLVSKGPGCWTVAAQPAADGRTLSLQLVTKDRSRHRVAWPCDTSIDPEFHAHQGPAGWIRSPRGLVQVATTKPRCRAVGFQLDADRLVLELEVDQVSPEELERAELASDTTRLHPDSVDASGPGRWALTFPLLAAAWTGLTPRPIVSGTYTVTVPHGDAALPVTANTELLGQLPLERVTSAHRVRVMRAPRSAKVQFRLGPPLAEDELGKAAQRRLAKRYRETEFAPADQVFFQCYRGEFATDSQVAIHRKLYRDGVPLDLVWGISDLSADLPEGARGVIVGSWEWYEAIGRSRYLCNNIDFDRFFQRREYQRFLQTFHGYPFKSMGISFWRTKGFSDQLIAEECRRRTDAWTSIVVPADFCEEVYRREYRYDGEVLVTGYPRDDELVDPPPERREQIRERLGIAPGVTAVLYAPTWREADATGAWTARMFDELDLHRLASSLGPDHVVLVRGHNYNLRDPNAGATQGAGILDVTRYPEVNDLILAADVALLDYSSMRFDWLLTGKPLLFFVPDLEEYLTQRTALFEFGPTAPGPMLRTTGEVIEALRQLPAVSAEYADARHSCNERFNALNDGRATSRVVAAFFDQSTSFDNRARGDNNDASHDQGHRAGR